MSRIQDIAPADMSAEQAEVYHAIRARDGRLGGPYLAYIRIPQFMRINQEMGDCLRRSSIAPRLRQIIVLRVLAHWQPRFALALHLPASRDAGIEKEAIEAIVEGREPAQATEKERAALRVAGELLETRRLSDETYREALVRFGEAGLADVVALIGFYSMTSLTLNAFDIDPPAGQEP